MLGNARFFNFPWMCLCVQWYCILRDLSAELYTCASTCKHEYGSEGGKLEVPTCRARVLQLQPHSRGASRNY